MIEGFTMQPTNLNEWAGIAYNIAKSKGFHDKPSSFGERIALIHSEVSEALEADREGKWHSKDQSALPIDSVLGEEDNEIFKHLYEDNVKGSVEEEIADAMIRLFDLAGRYDIDIQSHVLAKMRYNSLRPRLHGKQY